MPVNIEIKAVCRDPGRAANALLAHGAKLKGHDHQVDTYFIVDAGRLKLREGNIENNLIFYKRSDQAGPKRSDVILYPTGSKGGIKEILSEVLGVKVVVDKQRDIYFADNVKLHIDMVKDLGSFVEIEAIGEDGEEAILHEQCMQYMELLGIDEKDLVEGSYSDLLERRTQDEN